MTFSRILAAGALAAALPAFAFAAPAKWKVDYGASKLTFVSGNSGKPVNGGFSKWTADIAFDPAQLAQSTIKVSVDIASVATNDGDANDAIKEDDWFAAKKFTTGTFTSTAIKAAGPGKYTATGNLTLRGVTKPATLNFSLNIAGDTATGSGNLVLARTAFGIGQGDYFKDGSTVPVNVTVNTTIKATKVK